MVMGCGYLVDAVRIGAAAICYEYLTPRRVGLAQMVGSKHNRRKSFSLPMPAMS
jgi:hypothetical protein